MTETNAPTQDPLDALTEDLLNRVRDLGDDKFEMPHELVILALAKLLALHPISDALQDRIADALRVACSEPVWSECRTPRGPLW